ncbi:hypothetical protein [Litoreibacter roseus]|uniref:DUF3299 domain-containing protein n=1 Tax=Litoreibacter roseus TaxID=2601869 RepID=A0A6N6JF18_9RHOB|nr:hypothetical protein [Litoreibacter roseus]GFE64953.1 hypothetical protein KIN_20270 [Litoreibacter roseus]
MNRRQFVIAAATAALTGTHGHASDGKIIMRDLYNKDLSFSNLALSLEGRSITVKGYMAPPLKADANFFVLTKMPMSVCPFCETEAEWPDDILAVHIKRRLKMMPYNVRIEASGVLELGAETDTRTGFVSRVRLTEARYS